MGDYFTIDALSQSGAKTLLRSPAQYRYDRDNPRPPTPAMQLGTLLHALVLEPTKVVAQFSTGPDLSSVKTKDGKPAANPAATAEGKALVAEWTAANPGVTVVSADDWAKAQAMAQALLTAPLPGELCPGATLADLMPSARVELEILWGDADCPLKAKLDAAVELPDGHVAVVDVKTTSGDLTTADLSRTVATFGYHRQAAHYLAALASQGVVDADFWFAFVQTSAPHEVAFVRLDGEALSAGAVEMQAAAEIYRTCRAADVWPSAQAAGMLPSTIGLPRWYRGGEG
ncbi:MAG: PD-(D/E)XK nuclease-like domain-containing protein [Deltaproteobacteria bacterium]|nr:PD-(D/E)XK nuclease-like domain-containing protein [Deltaproteobacteria bacterium]